MFDFLTDSPEAARAVAIMTRAADAPPAQFEAYGIVGTKALRFLDAEFRFCIQCLPEAEPRSGLIDWDAGRDVKLSDLVSFASIAANAGVECILRGETPEGMDVLEFERAEEALINLIGVETFRLASLFQARLDEPEPEGGASMDALMKSIMGEGGAE